MSVEEAFFVCQTMKMHIALFFMHQIKICTMCGYNLNDYIAIKLTNVINSAREKNTSYYCTWCTIVASTTTRPPDKLMTKNSTYITEHY